MLQRAIESRLDVFQKDSHKYYWTFLTNRQVANADGNTDENLVGSLKVGEGLNLRDGKE